MKKSSLILMLLLQRCSGASVAFLNPKDLVGKNVDEVTNNLKMKGLVCGQEYSQVAVGANQVVDGVISCATGSVGLICPESERVTIFFNPTTRKVLALGKSSKTNCF